MMFSAAQQDLTLLSLARADPSQITQILDSTYHECDLKQFQPTIDLYRESFSQYFDQCRQFLFGQINHQKAAEELKKHSSSGKGVCAKTLSHGDVAWKCETCEKDPTCIICQECFEAGDHKGHKVWLKRNVSGCCDCGDPDAWEEGGFCTKHKGYAASSESLLENLPQYVKKASQYVFNHVCLKLKVSCLQLNYTLSRADTYLASFVDPDRKKAVTKRMTMVHLLFEFIDWSVDVSPAFIHFLAESMNEPFIEEITIESTLIQSKKELGLMALMGLANPLGTFDEDETPPAHECCIRSYISEEQKLKIMNTLKKIEETTPGEGLQFNLTSSYSYGEAELREFRKARGICTCTVTELTFQVNHMLSDSCRHLQHELYFKMFQSFKFKQGLGLAHIACFHQTAPNNTGNMKDAISSIGVQVLTIDEISLSVMQNEDLRNNLVSTYTKAIDELVEGDFTDHDQSVLIHILYDLKYMTRTKTLKYAIMQTTFLESILEPLTALYYKDLFEYRSDHIDFDSSLFKEGLYNVDILLTKILKAYLKAVDYSDVQRNQRLMTAFRALLEDVRDRLPEANGKLGFFAIPLHRLFSYYLSRLILQNHVTKTNGITLPEIFRKYLVIAPGQNSLRESQAFLEAVLQPAARAWSFTHEILTGKWVMSGLFITHLPKMLYSVHEYYLLLNLGLFQMLLAVSPEPSRTVELLVGAFTTDPWLRQLHECFLRPSSETPYITAKNFEQFKPMFDVKKLRQMLHWELRLFTQMCSTESAFVYPLLTNLSRKEELTFPSEQEMNKKLEDLARKEIRRCIVHALVLCGGRADFKQLKSQINELYLSSEHLEEELLTVATQHRDGPKGQMSFRLKEEPYLSWFEPYYYLIPEAQAKLNEVLNSGPLAEKHLINEILGDYRQLYVYSTPVNSQICKALAQTPQLFKFLKSLIIHWCTQQADFKVIDEQIAHEALKLVFIMLKNGNQAIVQMIKDQEYLLVTSLRAKAEQSGAGQVLDRAIKEILMAMYDLDPHSLNYIGEMLGLKLQPEVYEQEEEEKQSTALLTQRAATEQKKDAAKKRQDEILKKFQSKRTDYMSKQSTPSLSTPTLSRQSSSYHQDEEDTDQECSLCRETLEKELFFSHPYGQFAYVSHSKLLYHAYRQTLEDLKVINSENEEEEKKQSMTEVDPFQALDINCLESTTGTGGTMIKCSHYAHYKCLTSYLLANESDLRKRDIRKLIGLNMNTFQCPLCKHISNVLLPCDTLSNYKERKLYNKDFEPYELIEFFTRYLSKIFQNQENKKREMLPIDIRSAPSELLRGLQRFVEHRIQLIDVKGIEEFLKHHTSQNKATHSHNRVGKEQYADLIEQTRNVLLLITEGAIPLPSGAQDIDMTEETLESICLQEISKILESRRGWRMMESDFSSITLQMMFYAVMLKGISDMSEIEHILDKIGQSVYKMVVLQVQISALYGKQQMITGKSNILEGKPSELYEMMTNLKQQSSDPSFNEQFLIPQQLGYLRKIAAFRVLIKTMHARVNQATDLNLINEDFIKKWTLQIDDIEEFQLLTDFLKLSTLDSSEQSEMQDLYLPDEINDILTFFSSPEQHSKILESYALSILIHSLNPQMIVDEDKKPTFKAQLMSHEHPIQLALPGQFLILQRQSLKFKLQSLPNDYQGLVQTYYKRICKNCGKQPKESCVCLLCGDIVCFLQKCCSNGVLKGMKPGEGELSYHARTCEGGASLYLCTTNGKIILVEDDRSSQRQSPYVNKFGETFSSSSKKWDNYQLASGGASFNFYEEYKKIYLNFSLANEVIKDRSMSDVVWRLRAV